MRIKISDGAGLEYELMVDTFVHNLKRYPDQLSLPRWNVKLLDLGSCLEVITIVGMTDDLSTDHVHPTKAELEDAVRNWGANANIMGKTGYPTLTETPNDVYHGQFGSIKFDYEAAHGETHRFELQFKVVKKVHTP